MLGLLIVIVLLLTGSPEAFKAGLEANARPCLARSLVSMMQPLLWEQMQARALPFSGGALGLIFLDIALSGLLQFVAQLGRNPVR